MPPRPDRHQADRGRGEHAVGRSRRNNLLETFAATDDVLLKLDAKQYELQQGPCYESATDGAYVVSSDLAADSRWPEYSKAALAEGVRAQAGISQDRNVKLRDIAREFTDETQS